MWIPIVVCAYVLVLIVTTLFLRGARRRASRYDNVPPSGLSGPERIAELSGQWLCGSCEWRNHELRKRCRNCRAERPTMESEI